MKRSEHRILTTHVGSLSRPADLLASFRARAEGKAQPGHAATLAAAVAGVVKRQRDTGIDIVNDGEMRRLGYVSYVKDRLGGFHGEDVGPGVANTDILDHPEFAERDARWKPIRRIPACVESLSPGDPASLRRDIELLKSAAAACGATETFMTAPSQGVVSIFFADRHYGGREAYLHAIGEAMRPDYEAIAAAGITLQIDCPDLAMGRHVTFGRLTDEEFRREAMLAIEALNQATRGIPDERMRIHLCWGNYEGPHHRDIDLHKIIDVVLRVRPAGLSIEACNPRHGQEWAVFERTRLPDHKYVVPGVIDSTTNYVEHPELVAQRLRNYIRLVGPDRVIAGADCGFGTSVVRQWRVVPSVTWAKLASMVEGARLASVGS
jgi:5-methyltetrahydropteroyltriglutamate--homocysteine methyltransferase